jgi:hypothetical protein
VLKVLQQMRIDLEADSALFICSDSFRTWVTVFSSAPFEFADAARSAFGELGPKISNLG